MAVGVLFVAHLYGSARPSLLRGGVTTRAGGHRLQPGRAQARSQDFAQGGGGGGGASKGPLPERSKGPF